MKNKTRKTSKTPKTLKYYYSKASILRSAIVSILCLAVFVAFFVCFMIYGGNDRNPLATYKTVFNKEREVLSMIDGIAADGEGRVYVFYSRTFEINVYDESGKYLRPDDQLLGLPAGGGTYTGTGGDLFPQGIPQHHLVYDDRFHRRLGYLHIHCRNGN